MRGLAIAGVMLSHFLWRNEWQQQAWWKLMQGGWLGVDLFFVLSGFLITGILLGSRDKERYWSNFYKRRILRIFPLYYAAVVFVWLTVVLVERDPGRLHGYDSFAWFFFMAPNIAMALKSNWLYHSHVFNLNHLWSVAVEEQFYLIWPLIVRFLPVRYLVLVCLAIIAASPALRQWTDATFGQNWSVASYVLPYCRFDGLAAGAFLAIYRREGWERYFPFDRWVARLLAIGMGIWLINMLVYGDNAYRGTAAALLFGALVYLALNPQPGAWTRRFFENRFLCHLGTYSYGLYVFHQMFEYVWMNGFGHYLQGIASPGVGQVVYIVLAFGGTYGLARLSWYFLEEPFLRLKDRWAPKNSP